MFFLEILLYLFVLALLLHEFQKRNRADINRGIDVMSNLILDSRRYNRDETTFMCEIMQDLESSLRENTVAMTSHIENTSTNNTYHPPEHEVGIGPF